MADKSKQELIIKVLEETKVFTQKLLKENERLRLMVAWLKKVDSEESPVERPKPEDMMGSLEERFEYTIKENNRLQKELENIKQEISKADTESHDYYTRYLELEEQNETLANLYVTISRLHSTLQFNEVIEIIKEIIINLVGSESFIILWLDEQAKQFQMIAGEGEPLNQQKTFSLGQNVISKAAQSGEIYISMADNNSQDPIACIPLKAFGRVVGVIVIYHLLAHKPTFSQTDFELFSLMAEHAASAIVTSMIFTKVGDDINHYISIDNLSLMMSKT
ncbi:MAG: GAF domain-containing protein [Acidobacteria bacterium]|nr:GAF domain-containing protein [Acidobacteriota bacterium]